MLDFVVFFGEELFLPKSANSRSPCPIACALDLVGDRWSLLIIRDLMFRDCHTYGDLVEGPEGISTNILADRLKRLEACELIEREAYQDHPLRYRYSLTAKGQNLRPLLTEMVKWGSEQVPGAKGSKVSSSV